jgi:hypothetical protein
MTAFSRLAERFNLLWFIMTLGLGGTAIAGFAVLNYTFPRPEAAKGLAHLEMLNASVGAMDTGQRIVFEALRYHIASFSILHLVLLLFVGGLFIAWRRRHPEKYQALLSDNARNAVTIAPALAVGMSFNVALVGGYFYLPWVREHMQALMPYALAVWVLMLGYTMTLALQIQKAHLERGFDVLKMHFGWLLVPFALGMTAVSGAGVAALAHDPIIARTAFFLSLIPFSMASFLLLVKLLSIFRTQYRQGLSERIESLPSFFIVIPIVTLLAITVFRYGHFFDHHFTGTQLPEGFFALVTGLGWAFELWYLALGLVLLGGYLKNYLFNLNYFDESQWGLVCPMVAMSVLGAFVYKTLLPSPVVMWVSVAFLFLDIALIGWLAVRQVRVPVPIPAPAPAQSS